MKNLHSQQEITPIVKAEVNYVLKYLNKGYQLEYLIKMANEKLVAVSSLEKKIVKIDQSINNVNGSDETDN